MESEYSVDLDWFDWSSIRIRWERKLETLGNLVFRIWVRKPNKPKIAIQTMGIPIYLTNLFIRVLNISIIKDWQSTIQLPMKSKPFLRFYLLYTIIAIETFLIHGIYNPIVLRVLTNFFESNLGRDYHEFRDLAIESIRTTHYIFVDCDVFVSSMEIFLWIEYEL